MESTAGTEFVGLLYGFLGEFDIVALARVREVHAFTVAGDDGSALVFETPDSKGPDNTWVRRIAFRTWSDPHLDAVLTVRRWDPWLEFDPEAVRSASRAQRSEWDGERDRRAVGADDLTSDRRAGGDLLEVTAAELDLCWEKAFGGDLPARPPLDGTGRPSEQWLRSASLLDTTDTAGINTVIDISLDDTGNIELSGHELGRGATAIGSEYEFWWTIPRSSRRAFLRHIGLDPRDPIREIVDNFSGVDGYSRLRAILEQDAAKFQIGFHSWMSTNFD